MKVRHAGPGDVRAIAAAHAVFSRLGFDGERKRGFVKYLNRGR